MTEKTILILEKRGCDFDKNDSIFSLSDLQNYRLIAKGWQPKNKKYAYILSIGRGCRIRTTYKNNPEKKLKKYVVEHETAINIDTEFENDKGSWVDVKLETEIRRTIYDNNYRFTSSDLLKLLNKYGKHKIDHIIILDNIYDKIEKIAGYREKNILDKCVRVVEIMATPEHHVVKFYDTTKLF